MCGLHLQENAQMFVLVILVVQEVTGVLLILTTVYDHAPFKIRQVTQTDAVC